MLSLCSLLHFILGIIVFLCTEQLISLILQLIQLIKRDVSKNSQQWNSIRSPIINWSNNWVSVSENYNFQEWWIQDRELSSSPTLFLFVAFPSSSDRKTKISLRSCWKMQICPANTSLSPPLMRKITSFILRKWISSNLLSPSRKAALNLVLSWFLISLSNFEAMMAGFSHCN